MGMRIVAILHCDFSHEWSQNVFLGRSIKSQADALRLGTQVLPRDEVAGLNVVQCTNDTHQTLGLITGYSMQILSHSLIRGDQHRGERTLMLMHALAEYHGYSVSKS